MFAVRPASLIHHSFVALFALILAPLVTQPVHASFVAATVVSGNDVQVVSFTYNGKAETAYAGAFQTTLYNANGSAATGVLTTYCVDVADELQARENVNVTAISTLVGGNGTYVGSLYANFAAGATTAVQKAGLQVAIWKTEYDGASATSNTGHFVVTAASQEVMDQAAYYYSNNKLVSNDISYLQVVSGQAGQSLVGPRLSSLPVSPSISTSAVPEPASVALLGMGLLGGFGYTVRRRFRSSPSHA